MKRETVYQRTEIDGKRYLVEVEVSKTSQNAYHIVFTFYKNVGFVAHSYIDDEIKIE